MAIWTNVALASSVLLCVMTCGEANIDGNSASNTISADDFLKQLHLKAPAHHVQRRAAAEKQGPSVHPLRRGNRASLRQGELAESSSQAHPVLMRKQQPSPSDSVDLGEGSSVQGLQSSWQVHDNTAAHQREQLLASQQSRKQLLTEAKKHFPETELQISDLQKQLSEHHTAVKAAKSVAQTSKLQYHRKLGEAQQTESEHEYDLMTNPRAEKAAMVADGGLQALKHVSDDDESKVTHKREAEQLVQNRLSDKLQEREVNIKAVKLFGKFKQQYEKKLTGRLATVSAEFHTKAMRAALDLAKKKFVEFKKPFVAKQAASEKKAQAAEADQQARQIKLQAEMDAKEKLDARAMFKAYVQRFHEMQQRTASEEMEQDLGESDSIEDSVKKHASQNSALNLGSKLDAINNMIGGN